jgi:hypothetical protein
VKGTSRTVRRLIQWTDDSNGTVERSRVLETIPPFSRQSSATSALVGWDGLLDAAPRSCPAAREPLAGGVRRNQRRARAEALARFDRAADGDPFLEFWFSDEGRRRIDRLGARLIKKD